MSLEAVLEALLEPVLEAVLRLLAFWAFLRLFPDAFPPRLPRSELLTPISMDVVIWPLTISHANAIFGESEKSGTSSSNANEQHALMNLPASSSVRRANALA